MHWILLVIAILCETLATAGLKFAEGFTKPLPSVAVIAGYLISFLCFSLAIKTISVSIAYAIWSGLGMVLIAVIGWLWFGQKLDGAALAGLAFIIAGIVIIHLFSKSITY